MRKFFTLAAGMLFVCGSISAQKKWTNVVVNGDFEGEVPSYTTLDEMEEGGVLLEEKSWNSFWSHEFPQNEIGEEQYQGTATIVEDALLPGNHCARVVARSEAIADSCGNKVEADGKLASWDCQFFIYSTEPIPQGKLVRMTLKVRAEKAGSFETQAHWAPGDYNHWQMFGNISDITTEWKTFTTDEVTVSADQSKEGDGKAFQSVAFNLSTDATGNVFYFDDIKLEIKDDGTGEEDPEKPAEWVNFLRKGTLTDDAVGDFTTFTGRQGATNKDEKAVPIIDTDNEPALKVTTVAWNASAPLKDSEGNDSISEATGEPVIGKYYIVDGDTILSSVETDKKSFDDWRTQFFVTVRHKFKTGQKFRFIMQARAARTDGETLEEPITLDSQIHTTPGGYIHWSFVGSIEGISEEWQTFEFGLDDDNPSTIPSEGNNGFTIAFNCNKNKDVPVDIFFRFDELSFMSNVVLDNERVLASEDIKFPVSSTNLGTTAGTIDMTNALTALEVTDFVKFIETNGAMKMKYINKETEDEAFDNVDLTAGALVDANGNLTEEDVAGITLELDEENTKDGILALNVINTGLSADAITKGIASKIVFENDFWRYLYNISFVDEEALGISEVKTAPKADVIYDLMGRKVSKANKGLYIVAGKKVLFK